jgi:hypothetical protein
VGTDVFGGDPVIRDQMTGFRNQMSGIRDQKKSPALRAAWRKTPAHPHRIDFQPIPGSEGVPPSKPSLPAGETPRFV